MIEYETGDILKADTEALVNTVNCVGVMGRGIALQFKRKFPANFAAYKIACDRKEVVPGRMFVFPTGLLTNPKYIVNFPTKRHWRGPSKIEDIDAGLVALAHEIAERKIESIAIPPLGSGLGGLHWPHVKARIVAVLGALTGVRIVVFEPNGLPAINSEGPASAAPKMTPGRAAMVLLMHRYLTGLLDPFVTLLEVHKLLYFMQEAGETLRLKYKKAPYGPYAENLRHVLKRLNGHMVSGYEDGGDSPDMRLDLVPGVVDEALGFLRDEPDTENRLARVTDLVDGFESPFGLELLATVHWLAKQEEVTSLDAIVRQTYAWNNRKRQFTERQIHIAVDVLKQKNWLLPHSH
jgi:O-acetyl-ADP-ribose deacetylase (regulator of RNase III)/uncharacterized protein YwgA